MSMIRIRREAIEASADALLPLLLVSGDATVGTRVSSMFDGLAEADALNKMAPTALVLGPHEFARGEEVLRAWLDRAEFPIAATNLEGPLDDLGIRTHVPVTLDDGSKLAILGLITPRLEELVSQAILEDLGLTVKGPKAAAEAAIERLGSEFEHFVLLSHCSSKTNWELAALPGVRAVVGNSDHAERANIEQRESGTRVPIVSAEAWGTQLGELAVLEPGSDRSRIFNTVFPVGREVPPDRDLNTYLTLKSLELLDEAEKPVAEFKRTLVGRREKIRTKQTNFGGLVGRAMRWQTGADVALINAGAFRQDVAAGPLRRIDLIAALPFGNRVTVVSLTGASLASVIKRSEEIGAKAGSAGDVSGAYLQASGIDWAASDDGGSHITIEGEPLEPARDYRVATIDYLASGGDGYEELQTGTLSTGRDLIDVLVAFLQIPGRSPETAGGPQPPMLATDAGDHADTRERQVTVTARTGLNENLLDAADLSEDALLYVPATISIVNALRKAYVWIPSSGELLERLQAAVVARNQLLFEVQRASWNSPLGRPGILSIPALIPASIPELTIGKETTAREILESFQSNVSDVDLERFLATNSRVFNSKLLRPNTFEAERGATYKAPLWQYRLHPKAALDTAGTERLEELVQLEEFAKAAPNRNTQLWTLASFKQVERPSEAPWFSKRVGLDLLTPTMFKEVQRVWVGVMDSGVQFDHPDLENFVGEAELKDFGTQEPRAEDDHHYGHGTHVAGLLSGVSLPADVREALRNPQGRPKLVLRVAKVTDQPDGRVHKYVLAEAAQWLLGRNPVVVNMSLTADLDSPQARERILHGQSLFVVAAGNAPGASVNGDELTDKVDFFPVDLWNASSKNVLVVAASNKSDRLARFSNRGHKDSPVVKIASPGVAVGSIVSQAAGPRHGWAEASGTSQAAPLVSLAAALASSRSDGSLDAGYPLRQRLLSSCDHIRALHPGVEYGCRLNLFKAVSVGKDLVELVESRLPVLGTVSGFAAGNLAFTRSTAGIGVDGLKVKDSGILQVWLGGRTGDLDPKTLDPHVVWQPDDRAAMVRFCNRPRSHVGRVSAEYVVVNGPTNCPARMQKGNQCFVPLSAARDIVRSETACG